MRSFIAAAVVIASGCQSRVSQLPCGAVIVGGDHDGVQVIATAGDRCEGPTPHLALSLEIRKATMDTASPADAGHDSMPCVGRMFRAHGLDQHGRQATISFEFHDLQRACRSGRGKLTVTSADKTFVVEDASFAPID